MDTMSLGRRLVILGLAALPTAVRAATCPPTRVLFVCPSGTVKSAIAREELRRRAATAGLPVDVVSRGLHPENHVSPTLAANLKADGIDPAREPALAVQQSDIDRADIVVAFDEAADEPALHGARAWRTPSWNADYAAAKADLAPRMDGLVAELRQRLDTCG